MSENKRPVSPRPAQRPAQTNNERPKAASGGRPASGVRTSNGTQRPASAPSRSYAGSTQPLRRPAPGQPPRRPKPRKGYPAGRRHAKRRVDTQTALALALIGIVLIIIIVLICAGIKKCNSSTTNYADYDIAANIHPVETQIPYQYAGNDAATSAGTDNTANQTSETNNTTSAVTTTEEGLRCCTIRSIGDFVMDDDLLAAGKSFAKASGSRYTYDFSSMLTLVWDMLGDADYTVANVDGSLGGIYKGGKFTGYPQFNTPPSILNTLLDCGVDMLTVANNHMLDGWFDGLKAALDNMDNVGMSHIGAFRTEQERQTPTIVEINGIKVGFLNYTCSLNNFENYGVDQKALDWGCGWVKNSNVGTDVQLLRNSGAEVIVCYMHWGTEYETTPDKDQEYYAGKLVKAGVDVIIGGHPHVVQAAKWLSGTNQFGEQQKTFCVYSIGNFLSNHYKIKGTEGGVIYDFTIQEKKDGSFEIVNCSYIPVYVWRGGNDIVGQTFTVVPCGSFISTNTRPSGMGDSDYGLMKASYEYQVQIMSQGPGALKNY